MWLSCNDSDVRRVENPESTVVSRAAYVLFYTRADVPHPTGKAASAFLRSRFPRVHKQRVDIEAVRANVWRPAGMHQEAYTAPMGSMRQISSRIISGYENAEARPVACVDMCQIRRCPEKTPECCDCRTNNCCCGCWRRRCCEVCDCFCAYCVVDCWAVYENLANALIWARWCLMSFAQFIFDFLYFILSIPCRGIEFCYYYLCRVDMRCLFCPRDPPRIDECCQSCYGTCAEDCASDVRFFMGPLSWWSGSGGGGEEGGVSRRSGAAAAGGVQ